MVKELDLLLVNPVAKKRVYQNLSKDLTAIETPFWAALTADFIRNKRFSVKILDANAENLSIEETANVINEYNPKLTNMVVYGQHPSASTPLMDCVGKLCKEIYSLNPNLKTILTGGHPSALPERTLKEEKCDYVCQGEGFYTLEGLLKGSKLDKIPGLWFREGKKIVGNPRAQIIKDLNKELKEVAWDLLPMDKYRAHNWHCLGDLESRPNYASISTTLGCPFKCEFCCINAPFGGPSYRKWETDWVMKQIDILVNDYGVKNLKIIDELFVLDPNHFTKIAKGIIDKKYDLNMWAYARVDTTKEEHLKLLKKAGFNLLALGIESGSEDVRKESEKGRFGQEDIRDVVKKIKKHGISVGGNYIFGLPEDDCKSMQKTLDLAIELNCEWANFYCAMAYPGSKLHQKFKDSEIMLPENDESIGWIGYSQHSYETLPLPTTKLTSKEVLEFRDKAFDAYFKNPRYLNIISEKFGENARNHIENMTKKRLKRKLLGD